MAKFFLFSAPVFFHRCPQFYVTLVRFVQFLVGSIPTPTGRKVDVAENCFLGFRKARRKKTNHQKKVVEKKKGGRHLFSRAFGGYRREHINYSDWLNLDRMVLGRMEL